MADFETKRQRELLVRGRKRRDGGDFVGALACFEKLLALQPDDAAAASAAAGCLRVLGRQDEAQRHITAALQQHPDHPEILREAARQAQARNQPLPALEYLLRALAQRPEYESVATAAVKQWRALGQQPEAIALVDAFLARAPQAFELQLERARMARRLQQPELALTHFEKARAARPAQANAVLLEMLPLLSDAERVQEAATLIQTAAAAAEPGLAWFLRGRLAWQMGNVEEALRCYREGIRLAPNDVRCHKTLCNELIKLRCYDEAEAALHQALQCLPDGLAFELQQLELLITLGRLEEAHAQATALAQRHPQALQPQLALAQLAIKTAHYDEAAALIAALPSATAPQRMEQAVLRARLAHARFDFEAAEKCVAEAMALGGPRATLMKLQTFMHIAECRLEQASHCLAVARGATGEDAKLRRRDMLRAGHLGALLRELGTNPFAARATAATTALPLQQKPMALAMVLRDEPHALAPSLALLLALRRLGALTPPGGGYDAVAIPRQIVQYWHRAAMPPDIAATTRSWARQCLGFAYQLFNDDSAAAFLARESPAEVQRAFRMATHPAMRADLFRLAYLAARGGVYADADDLCRYSIEPWLGGGASLLLLQEYTGSIGNNFIAAAPEHPLILAALQRVTRHMLDRQGGGIWQVSGPGVLTTTFCTLYADTLADGRLPEGVRVLEFREAHRRISMHLPRRYKLTDQHWAHEATQRAPLYHTMASIRISRPPPRA